MQETTSAVQKIGCMFNFQLFNSLKPVHTSQQSTRQSSKFRRQSSPSEEDELK